MNKHTPGPWQATPNEDGREDLFDIRTMSMTVIADNVYGKNAKLIAAAPELASLLQEILRGGNGTTQPVLVALRKAPTLLADIRAALAKAGL